jgi:DNA-binding MarR family transcriptional regulator
MSTFKKYKKIKSVLGEFPGVKTYKEFDILIEIGYHQEQGGPLTLKQLLLLEVASPATVRRYLANLVRDGMVQKSVSVDDHRAVTLMLSARTVRMMTRHLAKIVEHLHPMQTGASIEPRVKKSRAPHRSRSRSSGLN